MQFDKVIAKNKQVKFFCPTVLQKCATSALLKALDGKLLSDRASVAAR